MIRMKDYVQALSSSCCYTSDLARTSIPPQWCRRSLLSLNIYTSIPPAVPVTFIHDHNTLYFVGAGLLTTIEFKSSLSERSISISLMMGERYGVS